MENVKSTRFAIIIVLYLQAIKVYVYVVDAYVLWIVYIMAVQEISIENAI